MTLGEHFTAFVDEMVADGRYSTLSEVVRAGLRLVETQERSSRLRIFLANLPEAEVAESKLKLKSVAEKK